MGIIVVRCPVTGLAVATGILVYWVEFNRLHDVAVELPCPHCDDFHRVGIRKAWLAAPAEMMCAA
jgi:hypothetical protein